MSHLLEDLMQTTGTSRSELARKSGVAIKDLTDPTQEVEDKIANVLASRLTASYVAGLFDRSSSWNIIKVLPNRVKHTRSNGKNSGPINIPNYSVRIRFNTASRLLAKVLESFFGAGFVVPRNTGGFELFASNKKSKVVIEKLLPYLVVKRKKALDFLTVLSILEAKPNQRINIGVTYLANGSMRVFRGLKEASKALKVDTHTIQSHIKSKEPLNGNLITKEEFAIQDHMGELEKIYLRNRIR